MHTTNPPTTPAPEAIRDARRLVGLTQPQAAALVYVSVRTWQYWEAGTVEMPLAHWELFGLKTESLPRKP